MEGDATLAESAAWADLLTALSTCLRDPDEALYADVESGAVGHAVAEATDTLGLDLATPVDPPRPSSLGALSESSVALFQAMRTPYAPNAESPYKPWYGERAGLMGGPPAEAMVRRYDAIEASFPEGYPPDHVALVLEYGAFLLEAGGHDEFAVFVEEHFDWFPAFRLATAAAAADAPFHRWAVSLLDEVASAVREAVDVAPVPEDRARAMVDRVADAETPSR